MSLVAAETSMKVVVDGNRSSLDAWVTAHQVPLDSLPPLSAEEQASLEERSLSSEEHRRLVYAAELTRPRLEKRAFRLGQLVNAWLHKNNVPLDVTAVWLQTLEGKFQVDCGSGSEMLSIVIREDLIDDMFEGGSDDAERRFERLLAINVPTEQAVRAG